MSLITKLEQDFESLKTKIAGASARVEGCIATGLKLGNELESFTNSGVGRLVIPEVLSKIGVTDPAMQEDIINAIPKALSYGTQAQTILEGQTPEDQLNLFLADIANDAPGTKVAKIDNLITGIIASLDNNSLIPALYGWLFNHSKTAAVVNTPAPVEVAAPVAAVVPVEESPNGTGPVTTETEV